MREVYRKRVETLLEALPYIRLFSGKTVVIKYGGAAMSSADLKDEFATDIALLRYVGIRPIIVHGGGGEVSSFMGRLNMPVEFVDGLRVTDAAAMEVAKMVLVGKVNKEIVALINQKGVRAVGLSGDDGLLLEARRLERRGPDGALLDLGRVGEVVSVNTDLLNLLESEYVPVVASVGAGPDGESYNINADSVAAALATALKAEKLVFLTDVAGLYADFEDENSLISECFADEVRALMESGTISRGMLPKLEAVLSALDAGVRAAHIIDGRVAHSILLEILTEDSGVGTMIRSGVEGAS
ncbi:MAG: acetylglutamate kinase [Actinobacteria bacterium]|nr:acetylglutamate kinase [Actinomycetota bacterium]